MFLKIKICHEIIYDSKTLPFVLIKYVTGFIIALEVDKKFLDVESHSLILVNCQKGTSPSLFLRNQTSGVISTTERLLIKPQTTGGENNFLEFSV